MGVERARLKLTENSSSTSGMVSSKMNMAMLAVVCPGAKDMTSVSTWEAGKSVMLALPAQSPASQVEMTQAKSTDPSRPKEM